MTTAKASLALCRCGHVVLYQMYIETHQLTYRLEQLCRQCAGIAWGRG